jgi:uncharacterized membrane protein YedE/YeeE
MNLTVLFLGFVFGAIIQYARLNKYDVISGLALRNNFTVPKAIAMAIGAGSILIALEIHLGLASYHVKPFLTTGIMAGGLIFGAGMAILGYCPGTLAISLGEGSLDALAGIVGGLLAGFLYTLLAPAISGMLGPDLGELSLFSLTGSQPALFWPLLIVSGLVFMGAAFLLHRIDPDQGTRWIISGVLLALLATVVFSKSVSNRVIGASTTYPYLADLLTGNTDNAYFEKIKGPGSWEVLFLGGAFLAGLVISVLKKDFKLILLHNNWKQYKNNSPTSRIFWALAGGFLLIFGARMAGGCTSGHILSGGMQIALSSLVFAVFTFAGLLGTGWVFYKNVK